MAIELTEPPSRRYTNETPASWTSPNTRSTRNVLVQLVVVVAMLASMLSLNVATAEPAEAQQWRSCPAGAAMINGTCYRQVMVCPSGYGVVGNQCVQYQQSCPYGGYLWAGRCHIRFWGQWGSYTPVVTLRYATPYYAWQPV